MKPKSMEIEIFRGSCQHYKVNATIHWDNNSTTELMTPGCFDTEDEAAEVSDKFAKDFMNNFKVLADILEPLPDLPKNHNGEVLH